MNNVNENELEIEDSTQDKSDEEDYMIVKKSDIVKSAGLVIVAIIFGLFIANQIDLLHLHFGNDADDAELTLEVTDWDIDVHPRKFLVMDNNNTWSYEYELTFDVWVYSESNGITGGYPYSWIGIYYVVNNETIDKELIYISESSGSASHHQKRLNSNHRVTDNDDVKIILEFPHSGFEWVHDAKDFTRSSWLIVYNVDTGVEEG